MAPPAEPRGGPLGGGWSGPWDSCVRLVFGMRGRRAGCERAPGAAGRMGGVPAWKEMEEGASGWPFPSLPSFKPGARARGARGSSLDRWAGEPMGACYRREGWAGVVPRHARRGFDLAERRGASACYSSAPESCGGWRQGRQERFGLGRRTSCQAVKLSESDEGWWW